jgi:hypothetical protein
MCRSNDLNEEIEGCRLCVTAEGIWKEQLCHDQVEDAPAITGDENVWLAGGSAPAGNHIQQPTVTGDQVALRSCSRQTTSRLGDKVDDHVCKSPSRKRWRYSMSSTYTLPRT